MKLLNIFKDRLLLKQLKRIDLHILHAVFTKKVSILNYLVSLILWTTLNWFCIIHNSHVVSGYFYIVKCCWLIHIYYLWVFIAIFIVISSFSRHKLMIGLFPLSDRQTFLTSFAFIANLASLSGALSFYSCLTHQKTCFSIV